MGLGFRVRGVGSLGCFLRFTKFSGVQALTGLRFGVAGFGYKKLMVWGLGFGVLKFRVLGLGFGV